MTSHSSTPSWSSSRAFFLATVGSAIGLGNIWRFSYLAGENGGGAFILIYAVAVLLIGLPVMLGELAIGRAGNPDPAAAYPRVTQRRSTALVGWLAVLACIVTLSYYAVVAGWVAHYIVLSLTGALWTTPPGGYATTFKAFSQHGVAPVAWQAAVMLATAAVVAAGVNAGIERLCRTLMPALAVIIVLLAAYSLTLPGSSRGLAFMLAPDWSALTRPQVYLAALGQAFFSLGVGYGVMLTFGAYAGTGQSLKRNAVLAAAADTAFALVAGVAVFGAVFAFGLNPASGPSLAFITLPDVFARMPGGTLFAIAFFALLLAAALTSAVSLLEVPVVALMQRTGMGRSRATWLLAVIIFLAGVPTALGPGLLSSVRIAGLAPLELYDTLVGEVLLPLSVLGVAVAVGWLWSPRASLETAGLGGRLGRAWLLLLRYAVPAAILLLMLASLWRR